MFNFSDSLLACPFFNNLGAGWVIGWVTSQKPLAEPCTIWCGGFPQWLVAIPTSLQTSASQIPYEPFGQERARSTENLVNMRIGPANALNCASGVCDVVNCMPWVFRDFVFRDFSISGMSVATALRLPMTGGCCRVLHISQYYLHGRDQKFAIARICTGHG